MRTRIRRQRGTGEKNYNLQGWVDVRKIVQIINGIEHLGTSVDSMSDLCRLMVELTSDMFWSKYSIPIPETIEEAYEWLQVNRYTVAQLEPTDRRVRTIKNAFEDDAKITEQANNRGRKYAPALVTQEDIDNVMNPTSLNIADSQQFWAMVAAEREKNPEESLLSIEDRIDPERKYHD